MTDKLENLKKISNPLTIIGIFATVTEVALTITIKFVGPELQMQVLYFAIGFAIYLVSLFFATLNFNPKVLYAPSDFKKDEHFLEMLRGRVSRQLENAETQLEAAPEEIVNAIEQMRNESAAGREDLLAAVTKSIAQITENVASAKEQVSEMSTASMPPGTTGAYFQRLILSKLRKEGRVDLKQWENTFQPFERSLFKNVLNDLISQGLVESTVQDDGPNWIIITEKGVRGSLILGEA